MVRLTRWLNQRLPLIAWTVLCLAWAAMLSIAIAQDIHGETPWEWLGPVGDLTFAAVIAGLTAQIVIIERRRDYDNKAAFVVSVEDVWFLDVSHAAIDFTIANAGPRDSAVDKVSLFRGTGPSQYRQTHFARFFLNERNDVLLRSGEKAKFVMEFEIAAEDPTPEGTLVIFPVFGEEGSDSVNLRSRASDQDMYARIQAKQERDKERTRYTQR